MYIAEKKEALNIPPSYMQIRCSTLKKKMQRVILIVILLIFNAGFAQEKIDPTDKLISDFQAELYEVGVTDFFILKRITYGTAYIFDLDDPNSCNPKGIYFSMYAFWNDGKDSYVKKIDNCGQFNSVKLANTKTTDYFKENIEKIKTSKVEFYQPTPDSIVDGINYRGFLSRTHQPQRHYWFYYNSDEFKNKFNTFNLTTEKRNPNLNYKSNNDLAIIKLNNICEKVIDKLNKKQAFNRI